MKFRPIARFWKVWVEVCLIGLVAVGGAAGRQLGGNATVGAMGAGAASASWAGVSAELLAVMGAKPVAELKRLTRTRRGTPEGAAAALALARQLEAKKDLEGAFRAYSSYLKNYPLGAEFEEVVRAMILIANKFLDKKQLRILGLPFGSGAEKAEKMFNDILEIAPFSKHAPIAQFNLGLSLERQGKLEEALQAYETVLERYPASSVVPSAMYQIGYANYRLGVLRGSQDFSALDNAKTTFEDFLLFFPQSENAAQAKENLEKLRGKEAADLYSIAQFYDKSKQYRAAFIYYNEVIRRNPSSKQAADAKTRIDELRATFGDDALRTGPEREQTGEVVALRRRLQAQTETPSLPSYAGPSRSALPKTQTLTPPRPRLRANLGDLQPLPAVEPELPSP